MSEVDRRAHARRDAMVSVVLDVELHGFDQSAERFAASGQTVDLSAGGMRARLDRPLQPGVRCVAHFPGALGRLARTMIYCAVRRSEARGDGYDVAVLFDTPLHEIELDVLAPEASA